MVSYLVSTIKIYKIYKTLSMTERSDPPLIAPLRLICLRLAGGALCPPRELFLILNVSKIFIYLRTYCVACGVIRSHHFVLNLNTHTGLFVPRVLCGEIKFSGYIIKLKICLATKKLQASMPRKIPSGLELFP